METPDNRQGALTEKIMAAIVEKFPIKPHQAEEYNKMYSAVYATLDKELLDTDILVGARLSNHSKRIMSLAECEVLLKGCLLALANKAGGVLTVNVQDILDAVDVLGPLVAFSVADDDKSVSITGMRRQ